MQEHIPCQGIDFAFGYTEPDLKHYHSLRNATSRNEASAVLQVRGMTEVFKANLTNMYEARISHLMVFVYLIVHVAPSHHAVCPLECWRHLSTQCGSHIISPALTKGSYRDFTLGSCMVAPELYGAAQVQGCLTPSC